MPLFQIQFEGEYNRWPFYMHADDRKTVERVIRREYRKGTKVKIMQLR